jgi:uncharacterized protein (TIGR03790 family)
MTKAFAVRVVVLAAVAMLLAPFDSARAQSAENVAVVINDNSPESQKIGQAYAAARSIPDSNIFHLRTVTTENVTRQLYEQTIEGPLLRAISRARLHDRILYIVLTKGVPLRIDGTTGEQPTIASVDSELTLLYRRMIGRFNPPQAAVANPYFLADRPVSDAEPFTHRNFDIFLVSRLDGFSLDDVLALIDRSVSPATSGRVVLDQRDALVDRTGDSWIELTSKRLMEQGFEGEVVLEATPKPARAGTDVLGYVSWGSTDPQNRVRSFGMRFSPGAIGVLFVGSGARTFREPPPTWVPTADPVNRTGWYAGSSESLIGDLIREGVTGAAGYVHPPVLNATVRPQILLPAYLGGFSLVEAFYLATPHLSWHTVIVGDPLCAPFRKEALSREDIEDGIDDATELPALFSKFRLDHAKALSEGIPEQAVALTLRAESRASRGDAAGTRQAIEEALQLAPRFVEAMVMGAALDESAGRRDEALEAYRRVLEVDPNNTIALNNLAYSLAVHQKKPAEGLPFARRAVASAPTSPTVLDTLAWIQHLMGDDLGASKLLSELVKTNPLLSPEIRLHAAVVFAAIGQRSAAQTQLALALKLNPSLKGSEEAKQVQSRLSGVK